MSPEYQGETSVVWRGMALAMVLTGAAGAQSSDGSFMSPVRFMQRDGEVIHCTSVRAATWQRHKVPSGRGLSGAG